MPELFTKKKLPTADEVEKFKEEIIELCKKHKLSIGHEDHHGGFYIHPFSDSNIRWFNQAVFKDE